MPRWEIGYQYVSQTLPPSSLFSSLGRMKMSTVTAYEVGRLIMGTGDVPHGCDPHEPTLPRHPQWQTLPEGQPRHTEALAREFHNNIEDIHRLTGQQRWIRPEQPRPRGKHERPEHFRHPTPITYYSVGDGSECEDDQYLSWVNYMLDLDIPQTIKELDDWRDRSVFG
ncbi:hypothetical protein EDB86DRAFT_3105072 [Lactarius hatsudake]|nr:hypothetical protein EDB86DRAFT_3105072 [Lactarius hatsudake]